MKVKRFTGFNCIVMAMIPIFLLLNCSPSPEVNEVQPYSYTIPEEIDDGWEVATLSSVGIDTTGVRADRFADDNLYIPMQMQEHFDNWPPLSDGVRSRDMEKFGYLFLNLGEWQGKQIISKKWVIESIKKRITTYVTSIGWLTGYGYQWWTGDDVINGTTIHMYAAWGNGGQVIAVFPGLDLVVVFTGGCFDDASRPFKILRDRLIPVIVG